MNETRRLELLGVPVDCLTWHETLGRIEQQLAGPAARQAVIAVNPEKIMKARQNPQLLDALAGAALLIPDGIGVVIAARLLGLGRMTRVAGSDLMPRICESARRLGHSVYLFGASEEVNERAARVLTTRYPGLAVAGRHHGYVSEDDMEGLVASINRSGATVLFVALGSPRQELWMQRHLPRLNVRLCQGVGGTFDVLAGAVRRAPRAFIRLNLEWLYRLLSQPNRFLRQTALPRFVAETASAVLMHAVRPSPSDSSKARD